MKGPYDDIIGCPHHVSPNRKRMSMIDRAAQFSPFAALTGYDSAIQETGRLTDRQIELAVDETAMLNEKIQLLTQLQEDQPEITVTYFVPDERKNGGSYITMNGRVKKIDRLEQAILMTDETIVHFGRILHIDGEIFQQYEGLYFFG